MPNARTGQAPELKIVPHRLNALTTEIFLAVGSEPLEAQRVADHLVAANLAGHDSHGVGMIPRYVEAIHEGVLKLNQHASIARDAGAVLSVDGAYGFGQVVACEAMAFGIERAQRLGICAVGLRRAHHIGRIGHWAEQCARAGLVSFHFVNVSGDPLVAPFGGIDARFGTNPFCAAFPRAGRDPLVLDFATSAIAYGKTRVAFNKGVEVPAGTLIDHAGQPTSDPAVMHRQPFGALLAFGGAVAGHKGYGLAAMCEVFAGALTGGFTTRADTLVTSNAIVNCMLSVIIDPNAFDAPDSDAEAEQFIDWVKSARASVDGGAVLIPGEPEQRTRRERMAAGIPVDRTTWQQIVEVGRAVGLPAVQFEGIESK
jgi:uncharacterized oxidoreductase